VNKVSSNELLNVGHLPLPEVEEIFIPVNQWDATLKAQIEQCDNPGKIWDLRANELPDFVFC